MKNQYKATFSNGDSITRTTNNTTITLGWCIMHNEHILFKGFSKTHDTANLEISRKLSSITGRADLISRVPHTQNRVNRYNRTHGVGSFEQYVLSEEKKYKTEIVKVKIL